jgi:hypothetical protein
MATTPAGIDGLEPLLLLDDSLTETATNLSEKNTSSHDTVRRILSSSVHWLAAHANFRVSFAQSSCSLYGCLLLSLKYGASVYVCYLSESRINS